MSEKLLLSGNEAIAYGAWEAGVDIGVGYPGTPSTETLEALSKKADVYTEWSPNEKVALEVGAGASFYGSRVLVTMKHVGLNVAADPLFTLGYTGVNGGLVLLVADDPGMHSSQNEQDSHNYAPFAGVIMLDPSDPIEAYEMAKNAFKISEKFDTVVILRSSVRVAHTKEMVEVGRRGETKKRALVRDPKKWVMMPAFAKIAREKLDDKFVDIARYSNDSKLNRAELRDKKIGVVCAGAVYHYVREADSDVSVYKVGISNPLPLEEIRSFASQVDELYVAEEADDYFERSLATAGIACKPLSVPRRGELTPELIKKGLGYSNLSPHENPEQVIARPPLLCAGCPHRPVFYALHKMGAIVTGDIGCYTLGAIPPLNGIDTCVCMGASVSMAHGIEVADNLAKQRGETDEVIPPVVGVIGDSTFAHSGITGVINTVYNGGAGTIAILDNRITAMTGHQGNPVNGITLQHRPSHELELEPFLKACGVTRVRTVDSTDIDAVTQALEEETNAPEYSVIIFRSPCILLTRTWPAAYACDSDKCRGCKICTKLGCPALSFDEITRKVTIEAGACKGCGLCAQVCTFRALTQTESEV
ncbi:MAG: indolepyruvate ferredoxin oxidoreductase subunit alpha [Coriobacteriia bacterium]|nr:indolepyruvate ferredoxin oxidoreductase subunit alpha [Coriobacteriia bacterium]